MADVCGLLQRGMSVVGMMRLRWMENSSMRKERGEDRSYPLKDIPNQGGALCLPSGQVPTMYYVGSTYVGRSFPLVVFGCGHEQSRNETRLFY